MWHAMLLCVVTCLNWILFYKVTYVAGTGALDVVTFILEFIWESFASSIVSALAKVFHWIGFHIPWCIIHLIWTIHKFTYPWKLLVFWIMFVHTRCGYVHISNECLWWGVHWISDIPKINSNISTTGTVLLLVTVVASHFCYRQSTMSISRRPRAWEDCPRQILIRTRRPSEGDMCYWICGEVGGRLATVSCGWDLVWASARVPFVSWCLIYQEFECMVWHYQVVSDVNICLTAGCIKCSGLVETFVETRYFIECFPGKHNMTFSLLCWNIIPEIWDYIEIKWFVFCMHNINNL